MRTYPMRVTPQGRRRRTRYPARDRTTIARGPVRAPAAAPVSPGGRPPGALADDGAGHRTTARASGGGRPRSAAARAAGS
ncbi:hypothetical protein, partial [Micromonospora olivasterospora]|uniref:hypothetical protein n=1 Tax=Micromonospora olivasterospora TaxID=1880 RepID=UPI0031E20D36